VDSDHFAERVERVAGGRQKPVIVYGANADCDASRKAAACLQESGFEHVFAYAGGIEAWEEAGEPVQGGARPEELR
jgi:rhodanese-related sulfurtransferase